MANHKNLENDNWQKLIAATKPLLLGLAIILGGAFIASFIPVPAAGTQLGIGSRLFLTLYNAFLFAGGMYLTSQYTSRPLNAFTNALSPYMDEVYLDPETEKYKALLATYDNLKPYLDTRNVQIFDAYFNMYRTWLYDITNPDWRRTVIQNISHFLEYNFKIFEHGDLNNSKKLSKQEINAKAIELLELVKTYPKQAHTLVEYVKFIAYYQLQNTEFKKIRALCLEGPPGVGKTTLIENSCHIFDINVTTLKGKAIIGQQGAVHQYYNEFIPANCMPIVNILHDSHAQGLYGYKVLFFDEIDKLPNDRTAAASNNMPSLQEVSQILLQLTDNDQLTIRDPYTGLYYPTDRIIVVLATNKSILYLIPGLASRVEVLFFDKIDAETKLFIAVNKLHKFCDENNITCDATLEEIVALLAENNHEDGVRELVEDIRSLVYSLSQNNFYEGTLLEKSQSAILNHYRNLIRDKTPDPEVAATDTDSEGKDTTVKPAPTP